MIVVNCAVKKNIPIEILIDTGADVNCISQKHISKLGITYHNKSNSIETSDVSYFTLGKVNLCITFNNGKKHKSIPSEFIVVGPDWPDYFSDLTLEMPWLGENGANFDIHNSLLTINDNFTILFEKVNYILTLSNSQIGAMTDFLSPTHSSEGGSLVGKIFCGATDCATTKCGSSIGILYDILIFAYNEKKKYMLTSISIFSN